MFNAPRVLAGIAAVTLAGLLGTGQAQAQFRVNQVRINGYPMTVQTYRVPPANYLDPFGINRANAYRIALLGQAYSYVPPYALGYNPYVPNYYGYGPMYGYGYTPYYPAPVATLYGVNPYFNPYGGMFRNYP